MIQKAKFAAIGEYMIELSHQSPTELTLAFAGDSYNTAVYLARYQTLEVSYITALGQDHYSQQMLDHARSANIDVSLMQQLPDALPGLYLIQLDEKGERHFYYYRERSAARQMFATAKADTVLAQLINFDYLYLSGISLAILDEASRAKLYLALTDAKAKGAKILFDSNYRPGLWQNSDIAREQISRFSAISDCAFPTFDDEKSLFADKNAEATAERIRKLGAKRVFVKQGADGVYLHDGKTGQLLAAEKIMSVVDTTAAGDAFNAACINALANQASMSEAARAGQQLAAQVIQKKGAIVTVDQ